MAFRWWADDGPFKVAFASSLSSSAKKRKENRCRSPPLAKLPGSAHAYFGLFLILRYILRVLSFSQRNSFKLAQHVLVNRSLTLFQLFTLIVVCSLFWLYTLVAYIANNITRSDCSWGRLIWVHNACFHVKTSLKCICIYAVGIKSRWHFLDKKYQQDI